MAKLRSNASYKSITKWRYLPMELLVIILWTNRVRCALNIEILDLLNEESVSVELGYKFDEKSYCECLKRWVDP